MNEDLKNNRDLILFFILTFLWSWIIWIPGILNSQGIFQFNEAIPFFLGIFASFGPTVIGVLMTFKEHQIEGVKKLFKRAWQWNFNKLYLIPVLFLGFTMALASLWLSGLIETFPSEYEKYSPIIQIVIDFFGILFIGGPLAEEFGWRGYALDKMYARWSKLASSLILGAIWSLWHLPLFFITGTSQSNIPIYQFMLMNTLLSVIYSWLYNNTKGSLSIAILFHLMMNLSAASIHYWYTSAGRWISFILTLIFVIFILWKTNLLKETKERHNGTEIQG
ncbi:CPBP family glutamic-type intramembrane protease [Candidatus Lokiarchaeum ossiferum]|uniref:CPBP family glutamic-type intramembrane protease n=1 Tax=Candidatus Lokiarchaeum ossiferum TaxID=2951803 RepID=UPI00352F29D6